MKLEFVSASTHGPSNRMETADREDTEIVDRLDTSMEELKKLRVTRGAHRGYVTRVMPRVRDAIWTFTPNNKKSIVKHQAMLKEKQEILKSLDEKILDIASGVCDEEDGAREVEDAMAIQDEFDDALFEIAEKLKITISPASSMESLGQGSVATRMTRPKLPKLELQKFSGKPQDWPEFWDAFSNAVDGDENLQDSVKFQYLRKSLMEPAASVIIAGFKMTSQNYRAAIELLKQRFAKPALIKRAHINEMLGISAVWDEKQVMKMRNFHDKVETHFRGLQSLAVDSETYSSIVVPVLLEKIPESVRLNMVRSTRKSHLDWEVMDLLDALKKELEVREMYAPIFKPGNSERRSTYRRVEENQTTASALHTWDGVKRCAFCLEEHEEENCTKVEDLDKHKSLIKRFGRCFICLKKGHRAVECRSRVFCRACKGKNHVAICNKGDIFASKENPKPTAPPLLQSFT